MPEILIPSRNVTLQFPDTMSEDEIASVIKTEYPKTGQDVAYQVGQQLQELQKSGGINTIEASNPISALSLEDFQLYKKHQLENGIGLKEGLPLIGDAAKHIVGAIFNGALEVAKDPFSKATYESALQGLGASVVGSGQLGQGIRDIVGKAADFVTGQTPHLSREEYRAAYPKTTDADWEQYMQAEQDRESKMLNYTLLADSLIKNAPKPEVAEVFSMVGLEDLATMGGASAARNVGKQVAEQVGKKTLLGKLADLTEKTRQGVLRGVEKTAKGVETVADLPQTVKEKLGGTVAGGIVGAGLASAGLAPTAGVLTGAATLKTGSSLLGGAARAAMEGPSRVGLLERMAQDSTMSKAAQRIAGALAQVQPAFRYAGQNVAEATKGAIGGGVVGGGMGYIVGGEEGMYSGIGSGIGIGGTSGLLGANIDFAKEAVGMSTSRTKAAAAGDIQRFIASRSLEEMKGYADLFARLAEKSSVEQAANTMDFLRIAEATGKKVRLAGDQDKVNANGEKDKNGFLPESPGWAVLQQSAGKVDELVLRPDKILNDTAPHETLHLLLNETVSNSLKPEVMRAVAGLFDPATGEQLRPGVFTKKEIATQARQIARAYSRRMSELREKVASKSITDAERLELSNLEKTTIGQEHDKFIGYADTLEKGVNKESVDNAMFAVVDEMVATYAGKLLGGRTRPGKFNPDRLPLAYRGALDSIISSFLNTIRTDSYRSGMNINLGNISTAFKSKSGKEIRIPELDKIITKAFAERAKGARAESKVLELPKNPKDLEAFAKAYKLDNVLVRDKNGKLRPKTGRELLEEARNRWANAMEKLQALSEEQRIGIDFSTDKDGNAVVKINRQISKEAVEALVSTMDGTSQEFLDKVFGSIVSNKKTTLNSTYYGVYERGKATNRMVAKVKEASHNEILPYAVEINSKDGIIVRAINMTSVFDRMADKLQRGSFKGLYPDYDTALRDFTKYLDNLTAQTPIDSAILLGGGEKGARKRNFFYDVLGFRNRKGESMINVPESEFKGRDAVNNVRSYRIERFTQLSPTNQGYSFDVATTYERAMKNFQPSEFVEETLPGGMASRNEQGWRILKRDDQKLFRVYNDLGEVVGVAGSKEDAADMALKKFAVDVDEQKKLNEGFIDTDVSNVLPVKGEKDIVILTPESLAKFQPASDVLLDELHGKHVMVMPADRMKRGEIDIWFGKIATVLAQGGASFMEEHPDAGWAWTVQGKAESTLSRAKAQAKPGETHFYLAVTLQKDKSTMSNKTAQRAYKEMLAAAVDSGAVSKKKMDKFIAEVFGEVYQLTKDLSPGNRSPIVRGLDELLNTPELAIKSGSILGDRLLLKRKDSAIPYELQEKLGISIPQFLQRVNDPRFADVPDGSMVAVIQFPMNAVPQKTGFHYSYEWEIYGKPLGYLKTPVSAKGLLGKYDPKVYTSTGFAPQIALGTQPRLVGLDAHLEKTTGKSGKELQASSRFQPAEETGSTQGNAELWRIPNQAISSADTSINQGLLPASFKKIEWKSGTVNADIGGGRFDNATKMLAGLGVENVIYDPFNRSPEHNRTAVSKIAGGKADTATVNNVLNVIRELESRKLVINQAADAVGPDGTAYFLIYEGNGSGQGKATTKGWQENRKAESYTDEIGAVFQSVKRKGNLLIATQPTIKGSGGARYQPGAIGTIDNEGNPVLVKTRDLGAAKHANHREITATGNDDGSRDFRFNASNGMVYWWNPGAVSSAEKQKLTDYLTAEGYTVKGHANVRDDFGAAHGAKYSPAEVDADYLAAVNAGDMEKAQRFQTTSPDIRFQPSQLTARDIDAIAAEVGGGEVKGGAKAFGAFMRSMREKGITLRDVVKSYGITLSSIRRQERKAETIKRNWPDAPFADGEQIRPEDAFATLLGTPEGKRYLDDAEKGEFNEAAADAMMQKFRAFGFHNKLKEQMQTAATQFFPQAQKIIDAVNNMPADEFIEFVRGNVKGISHGKIGFWSGQLGRGDLPTFDSRQGKLVYGKEVPVSKKVLFDQKARLPLLGIKVPDEYKDFAQTLLHHEIWDRLNGSDTEHAPIKEAMLKYSPDPVSPDILNGTDGSRLLKPKSGKWRIYSPAGILAGVRESQLDAERFALKKARMGWK